jgi:HAD superfamily hydrolase (TIGR01509 family)
LAQEYKGKSALDVGAFLWHHRCEGDGTAAEAGARLRAALIQEFAAGVEAMPGADALVRARLTRVQAIASGSPLEAVTAAVRHLGWGGSLEILVSSEEVAQGKPAPDVFVEAARRLGVMPERVLVVEDSLWGVRAARAAGMSCLAVPSSPDPRIAAEADQGLTSLDLLFG